MKNDATEELKVGDQINVNIVTGIGNVMRSSSKDASYRKAVDVDPNVNREKVLFYYLTFARVGKSTTTVSANNCEPMTVYVPTPSLSSFLYGHTTTVHWGLCPYSFLITTI